MNIKQFYTIAEAAKLSGLKSGMVDYLCRTEVVMPTEQRSRGRGIHRRYSFGDVVILRAVARLLLSGVSPAKLKKSLNDLRKHHSDITPDSLPAELIVTDGVNIFLRTREEYLETLDGSGQMAFSFVLEMRSLRQDILEAHKMVS